METLDETKRGLLSGTGPGSREVPRGMDEGTHVVAVHAELPAELHAEILQLFRPEAAHRARSLLCVARDDPN